MYLSTYSNQQKLYKKYVKRITACVLFLFICERDLSDSLWVDVFGDIKVKGKKTDVMIIEILSKSVGTSDLNTLKLQSKLVG